MLASTPPVWAHRIRMEPAAIAKKRSPHIIAYINFNVELSVALLEPLADIGNAGKDHGKVECDWPLIKALWPGAQSKPAALIDIEIDIDGKMLVSSEIVDDLAPLLAENHVGIEAARSLSCKFANPGHRLASTLVDISVVADGERNRLRTLREHASSPTAARAATTTFRVTGLKAAVRKAGEEKVTTMVAANVVAKAKASRDQNKPRRRRLRRRFATNHQCRRRSASAARQRRERGIWEPVLDKSKQRRAPNGIQRRQSQIGARPPEVLPPQSTHAAGRSSTRWPSQKRTKADAVCSRSERAEPHAIARSPVLSPSPAIRIPPPIRVQYRILRLSRGARHILNARKSQVPTLMRSGILRLFPQLLHRAADNDFNVNSHIGYAMVMATLYLRRVLTQCR